MKLERVISTELEEGPVCERMAAHFALAGYTPVVSQPRLMSYRRGKFLTLTAKGCKVNAVVRISAESERALRITVTLDIDTTGQFVVGSERRYWHQEMDGIAKAILAGAAD